MRIGPRRHVPRVACQPVIGAGPHSAMPFLRGTAGLSKPARLRRAVGRREAVIVGARHAVPSSRHWHPARRADCAVATVRKPVVSVPTEFLFFILLLKPRPGRLSNRQTPPRGQEKGRKKEGVAASVPARRAQHVGARNRWLSLFPLFPETRRLSGLRAWGALFFTRSPLFKEVRCDSWQAFCLHDLLGHCIAIVVFRVEFGSAVVLGCGHN